MNALEQIARGIATDIHDGQVDKAGEAYIEHVRRVAESVEGDDAKAVAWLHDVLEDSDETPDRLALLGVPYDIIDAVVILTRSEDDHMNYQEYIQAIKDVGNALAIAVKIADLKDHLRKESLIELPVSLQRRYAQALVTLAGEEGGGPVTP